MLKKILKTILWCLPLFLCSNAVSQTIWVKIESLPKSLVDTFGTEVLHQRIAQGIVDSCNAYTRKVYGFENDLRVLEKGEYLPVDDYSLSISLRDTVANQSETGIHYRFVFFEKEYLVRSIESTFSWDNKSPEEMIASICVNSGVVYKPSISRNINTRAKNLSLVQKDSLNLWEDFLNVFVSFEISDSVEEMDARLIENRTTNQWNITQASIWDRFTIQSKSSYFNLYFPEEDHKQKHRVYVSKNDTVRVIYQVSKKNQETYLIERRVLGYGKDLSAWDTSDEIIIEHMREYPVAKLSGLSGYMLMKGLLKIY